METWPSHLIPNSMTWHLRYNSKSFVSEFNQSVNTHRFPGGKWVTTLTFKNLTRSQAVDLQCFLDDLGGEAGRFLMSDFTQPGRPAIGAPVVAQQGQTGGLLLTSGWLPDRLVLAKGEYFSVNNEMKRVKRDVWSNGAGNATLEFSPWLRASPALSDAVETESPLGLFKLANDEQGDFKHRTRFSDVTLSIEEAFYV